MKIRGISETHISDDMSYIEVAGNLGMKHEFKGFLTKQGIQIELGIQHVDQSSTINHQPWGSLETREATINLH